MGQGPTPTYFFPVKSHPPLLIAMILLIVTPIVPYQSDMHVLIKKKTGGSFTVHQPHFQALPSFPASLQETDAGRGLGMRLTYSTSCLPSEKLSFHNIVRRT